MAIAFASPATLSTLALIALVCLPRAVDAGNRDCVDGVEQVKASDDIFGYHQRRGRCEGRYAFQPYSTEIGLRVVSLTRGAKPFPTGGRDVLSLLWPTGGMGAVSIHAVALDPRRLYRMDALEVAEGPFFWPMDVLVGLGLSNRDIGVVARGRIAKSREADRGLVPLTISRRDELSLSELPPHLTLQLLPSVDLDSVRLRLFEPGGEARVVFESTAEEGPYPAFMPITLRIEQPAIGGAYRLEIGGTPRDRDGPSVALEETVLLAP